MEKNAANSNKSECVAPIVIAHTHVHTVAVICTIICSHNVVFIVVAMQLPS